MAHARSVRFDESESAAKPSEKQTVQSAPPTLAAQLLTQDHLQKFPHARLMGYARVSTEEQLLDVQIDKMKEAGVQDEDLFADKLSAVSAHRPWYALMRKQIQPGDFLIVYSVSRLARDAKLLLTILDELAADNITVISLTERLDLKSATGRMQITMVAAIDEMERGRVRERTKDAMQLRKRQGMYLGRPILVTPEIKKQARAMRRQKIPVSTIATRLGISKSAVYGAL